eukprot:5278823-Amphidinium_carterae.3
MLPEPASPIELLVEVDVRAYAGTNPRADVKAFLSAALQSQGAHNQLYSVRQAQDDPSITYSAKVPSTYQRPFFWLEVDKMASLSSRPDTPLPFCRSQS